MSSDVTTRKNVQPVLDEKDENVMIRIERKTEREREIGEGKKDEC